MSKKGFTVPENERHAYKMLVQRANRRVKSNLKYIRDNKIEDYNTRRALIKSFDDPMKWSSGRMPFSRSIQGHYVWNTDTESMEFREFKSESQYRAYIRELENFGKEGKTYNASPTQIIENYKSNIIKSLNAIKDHYNITTPNGQIPKEILDALDTMTLKEATNFYTMYDVEEELERENFDSDAYANVTDAEGFVDVTLSILGVTKAMVQERTAKTPKRRRKRR